MNARLRVLLVGRHFWPHGSIDSAGYLIQLANGLQRRSIDVEVLTPRYASAWTSEFRFGDVQVHRPIGAPRSDWSVGRYLRNMTNWLNENAARFDVLLCDAGREESIAVIDSAKSLRSRSVKIPAVVRISGYGEQSDRYWWESSRSSRRCAAQARRADCVIVSNADEHRELISQGFSASAISRIDDGFDQATLRTPENRVEARRALTAINSDFHAPPDEPVALCVTNMVHNSGIQVLIESARHLIARYPKLHIWFIGDGPRRESIFQYLRGEGVRASIAMPGSFGNMEDVFRAADVFLHTDDTAMQHFLPTAVTAELPIVAVDNRQTRSRLLCESKTNAVQKTNAGQKTSAGQKTNTDQKSSEATGDLATNAPTTNDLVHWYQASSSKTFRKAVRSAMDDLNVSHEKAAALKRSLVRVRSFSNTIDDYADLLAKMKQGQLSQPLDPSQGSSFGAVS